MTTPVVMEPSLIRTGNLFSHQIIFAYLIPGIWDSDAAADDGYDGDVICTLNHHQSFPSCNNNDTH